MTTETPRIERLFLVLVLTAGLAAGCAAPRPDRAPAPEPEVETAPAPRAPTNSPAVVELASQAREARQARRHDTAVQLLERAIRIEPQNGALWHELARAHFELGHYEQAQQLAARSNALIARDSTLKASNDRLIDAARDARSY